MADIFLLRHGKVDGEAALYGHTDVSVTEKTNQTISHQFTAYCQQEALVFNQLLTSPLTRCASLAQAISYQLNDQQIQVVESFKEMNFGLFDGVPFDTLHQQSENWQLLENFWQNPVQHSLPNAELLTGFSYRVNQAWKKLIEQTQTRQGNVLLVCHGGVIRMILAQVLNVDFRNPLWYTQLSIDYGSLTRIQLTESGPRIKHIAKPLQAFSDEKHFAGNTVQGECA